MDIGPAPRGLGSNLAVEQLIAEVRSCEEMGFSTIWLPELFDGDPMTVLTALSRETTSIRLGTAITKIHTRHPVAMAQQAMTISTWSDGRFILGIGPSHKPVIERFLGLSYDKPRSRMEEYLDIVLDLVREGTTERDGDFYTARASLDVNGHERTPVYISALGPRMLHLAADKADGIISWMAAADYLESTIVPTLTSAAEEAGRPRPRIVAGFPVCVTDDPDGAREAAAQEFRMYGKMPNYRRILEAAGMSGPEDLALVGSEEEVHAQLRRLVDLGIDECFAAPFSHTENADKDFRRTMESLAAFTG